jgi:hypothetical protein
MNVFGTGDPIEPVPDPVPYAAIDDPIVTNPLP